MALPKIGDLMVDEDMRFQKTSWRVQRIGWFCMGLVILLALLGIFGPGPLSETAVSKGPLQLTYHRFVRVHSPQTLDLQVKMEGVTSGQLTLWIHDDFASRVRISEVLPLPITVESRGDALIYTFAVAYPPLAPPRIQFRYEHDRFGRAAGRVGLLNGDEVVFHQTIYP